MDPFSIFFSPYPCYSRSLFQSIYGTLLWFHRFILFFIFFITRSGKAYSSPFHTAKACWTLTKVHVSELKLTVHPALVGGLWEVLECFAIVLFDAFPVQIHETEPALTHRVTQIRRLLEILVCCYIVLFHDVTAFEINLWNRRIFQLGVMVIFHLTWLG